MSPRERGISFKDPLVLSIERGEKTKTRRLVGPGTCTVDGYPGRRLWRHHGLDIDSPRVFSDGARGRPDYYLQVPATTEFADTVHRVRPIWEPGDRLWVKQALGCGPHDEVTYTSDDSVALDAEGLVVPWPWKPAVLGAMYCPRWASRLTLEITEVRVERLRDLSERDAWDEGIEAFDGAIDDVDIIKAAKTAGLTIDDGRAMFGALWDSINGHREGAAWADNPWVWVISFRRLEGGGR